jgi:hypothetical protein
LDEPSPSFLHPIQEGLDETYMRLESGNARIERRLKNQSLQSFLKVPVGNLSKVFV